MALRPFLQALVTVFTAELPDKTMIATLVLVARYRRPLWVWVGAVSAFSVHVLVAVAAGSAISLLPDDLVSAVVAVLFAVGAVVLFRAGRAARADAEARDAAEGEAAVPSLVTPWATVAGSFGVIIVAEWGDLTQLATASLAARSGAPVGVGLGAGIALGAVAAIACTAGKHLVARVEIHKVNFVGAAIFAGLAAWTLAELLT